MTIDQHARARAAAVRSHVSAIVVPEPRAVIGRVTRRRRTVRTVSAMVLAAIILVPLAATLLSDRREDRVRVTGASADRVPAGTRVSGRWAMIPKASAGLGTDSSFTATASHGTTALVAGSRDPDAATIWRSTSGFDWHAVPTPPSSTSISAIAMHGETALAIGAPGGTTAFVWRSADDGRTWTEIARGDLFGKPATNSRPGAYVIGLLRRHGWWIAYGGAAKGYEAIWISRDGVKWRAALDSGSSGGIDGIVDTSEGYLLAYAVGATTEQPTLSIGWFTRDPSSWGQAQPLTTPGRLYLGSVTAGAGLATAADIDRRGAGTVLRSEDAGHSWREDSGFHNQFPDSWPLAAIKTPGGFDLIAGTTATESNSPGAPQAWNASAGVWESLPSTFQQPSLPTTTIPQVPPSGALSLLISINRRVVMLSADSALDRYYTVETGTTPR